MYTHTLSRREVIGQRPNSEQAREETESGASSQGCGVKKIKVMTSFIVGDSPSDRYS